MTLRIKPVAREDVRPLIALETADDQDGFVSSNAVSLAEMHYEAGAHAFALMAEDRHVGLALVIDRRKDDDLDEGEDPNVVYFWRLLIDRNEQRKGYGSAAVDLIIDWARDIGVPRMLIQAVPENTVALELYENKGFVRTGRIVMDEVELAKVL